jgi:phage-related protein
VPRGGPEAASPSPLHRESAARIVLTTSLPYVPFSVHSQRVLRPAPKLGCVFYRAERDDEPVRDWLRGLDDDVCKTIGKDILKVQWRWPTSRPLVGAFGDGLYEVRSAHDGTIYRVFFCIEGSNMVLLHGFMKKTQATPDREVKIARARQRTFRRK